MYLAHKWNLILVCIARVNVKCVLTKPNTLQDKVRRNIHDAMFIQHIIFPSVVIVLIMQSAVLRPRL